MQVVERLERVGITREEFCIMKALVLVNADTRIEEHVSVKKLRDSILMALSDCVSVLRLVLISIKSFLALNHCKNYFHFLFCM